MNFCINKFIDLNQTKKINRHQIGHTWGTKKNCMRTPKYFTFDEQALSGVTKRNAMRIDCFNMLQHHSTPMITSLELLTYNSYILEHQLIWRYNLKTQQIRHTCSNGSNTPFGGTSGVCTLRTGRNEHRTLAQT